MSLWTVWQHQWHGRRIASWPTSAESAATAEWHEGRRLVWRIGTNKPASGASFLRIRKSAARVRAVNHTGRNSSARSNRNNHPALSVLSQIHCEQHDPEAFIRNLDVVCTFSTSHFNFVLAFSTDPDRLCIRVNPAKELHYAIHCITYGESQSI